MSEQMQSEEVEIEDEMLATSLLDAEGQFVEVDQRSQELHRRDEEELLDLSLRDILAEPSFEHGRDLQKVLNGDDKQLSAKIVRGDGTVATFGGEVNRVEMDGEVYLQSHYRVIEGTEDPSPAYGVDDSTTFENITEDELEAISQNVRVDCPDGEMPLNAIMMDLAVGHNELEQYKQGALTLHQCLDERLVEEERNNPDSVTCDVLESVKKTAFGLYLRLQRGDEELHGDRDGKYSGYFKN